MADYRALLTARAEQDVLSRERKQQLWPGKIWIDRTDRWKTVIVAIILSVGRCVGVGVGGKEGGRVLELGVDVARGQQAEVANLYELVGQDSKSLVQVCRTAVMASWASWPSHFGSAARVRSVSAVDLNRRAKILALLLRARLCNSLGMVKTMWK